MPGAYPDSVSDDWYCKGCHGKLIKRYRGGYTFIADCDSVGCQESEKELTV